MACSTFNELDQDHGYPWPDNYKVWLPKHTLSVLTHPYWNPDDWQLQGLDDDLGQSVDSNFHDRRL